MTARKPAGHAKIRSVEGWRRVPFVMGGAVRLADNEWLDEVWTERPAAIYDDRGVFLYVMAAKSGWSPHPWEVSGPGGLRFRRVTP